MSLEAGLGDWTSHLGFGQPREYRQHEFPEQNPEHGVVDVGTVGFLLGSDRLGSSSSQRTRATVPARGGTPTSCGDPGPCRSFLSSDLLHELARQTPRPSHPASPLSHRGGRPCCRMQNEPSGRWRSPWAPTLQSRNRRTPMAARLEFPAPSRVWPFTTVGRAHLSQYLKPISQKKTDLRIRTPRFG